ncbi:MAG: zinc-dependent metalloprotease [Bacteroidota bacterium]
MNYIRIALLFVVCCMFTISGNAQSSGYDHYTTDLVLNQKQNGSAFTPVTLFNNNNVQDVKSVRTDLLNAVRSGTVLAPDAASIAMVKERKPHTMTLQVPSVDFGMMELELVRINMFSEDFAVYTSSSNGQPVEVGDLGVHYRGIIKDVPGSMVALSVINNEIMGLVSSENLGNMVLGRLDEKSKDNFHIFYHDGDLLGDSSFNCSMPDDNFSGYTVDELHETAEEKAPGDCLRVYVEVGTDIYNAASNDVGVATNFITGLFNESITLYANESIPMVVSSIFVWDTNDPYSGSNSSSNLNVFQSQHNSYASINNADLGHYVNLAISGGVAAGFSGVCSNNVDNSLCVSGIETSYNSVPTYSWSVMVVTHEMGHLIGSRHTHACVWNGNNTAIDSCAGGTEGSCSSPGNPSGGGTIMSYCHLTSVGINLSLGFGPQPGAVIRNTVDNANCTSPCGPPTCSDGIQNQDETGVDCGGATCPACPTCNDGVQNGDEEGVDCGGSDCAPCPCNGTTVTLTINLDNYPEETTWDIRNGGGTVVASGGAYGSQPDGSQVVEVACLSDGCYDFTIYDSYGDGICCGYGIGDYTLQDDQGNTLASGGSFGSSETTNFCVSSGCPAAGTACDDGDPATINDVEDGNCNCAGTCISAGTACNDGNPATENDQWDGNCNCVGTPCPAAGTACNDGNPATENDVEDGFCNCAGTPCPSAGTACNDGNPATENDVEDGFCNCAGTPCPSAGTACNDGDSATINDVEDGFCNCAGSCIPAGTPCDDGNSGTINDEWDGNCNCVGEGCPSAGTPCDDGNAATFNDVEDGNCNCVGTPCPSAGTSCNDGNAATFNDVEDGFCNCAGTPCPSAGTACDDGDSATINDVEDGFCNCAGSCIPAGTPCDDGNANTENDQWDGNCNCQGTPISAGCTEVYNNFNNFDTWGIWNDGGSDCRRSANDAAWANSGSFCVRLRDDSNTSFMTTDDIDLSNVHELEVDFNFIMRTMESTDEFWLQVSLDGGATYQTVSTYTNAVHGDNVRHFYTVTVTVTGGGTFTSNTRVRFRCNSTVNNDRVYIDDVTLSGCSNGAAMVANNDGGKVVVGAVSSSSTGEIPQSSLGIQPAITDEVVDMRLYPNPASNNVTIEVNMPGEALTGRIMDVTGRIVWTGEVLTGRNSIPVGNLLGGMYYLNVTSETGASITKKFVKAQ